MHNRVKKATEKTFQERSTHLSLFYIHIYKMMKLFL